MYEEITYEVTEPVATITLNRPKALNAWTTRMGAEVKHAVAAAEDDARVVGIVITGAGRGFCAGADLNDLRRHHRGTRARRHAGRAGGRSGRREHGRVVPRHLHLPPLGAEADHRRGQRPGRRHGRPDRARLRPPLRLRPRELHHLLPAPRPRRRVGRQLAPAARRRERARARPPALGAEGRRGRGRAPGPREPRRCRTTSSCPSCAHYVEELAANCSPASMAIIKRQVYQHWTSELGPAEREAVRLMLESFQRPDFREGVVSFLEKRPPRFRRLGRA